MLESHEPSARPPVRPSAASDPSAALGASARPRVRPLSIRLVSINIWDLPFPFPRHHRHKRRKLLIEGLAALNPDLVVIQEAFVASFKPRLQEALPNHYTDGYASRRGRGYFLFPSDRSGGLLTLSRWPIVESHFVPSGVYHGWKPDERIARKGCLWTDIDTPAGFVRVGNVHLYAGRAPQCARVRALQTAGLTAPLAYRDRPVIMAGDFNIAAETERVQDGASAFDIMEREGFKEVAGGASNGIATMDTVTNPYARVHPWRRLAARFEQVFYRGPIIGPGPDRPRLCLHDPPVSDHYGLLVTLSLTQPDVVRESE